MVDDHTLAEHEPGGTPGGGELIRGPWVDREPQPAPPPLEPNPWAEARANETRLARRDRRADTEASRWYQRLVLIVARARYADPVDVMDELAEELALIDADLLHDVLRQRLAGHRTR